MTALREQSLAAGGWAAGAPSREATRWPITPLIALQLMSVSFAISWLVGFQLLDARGIGQLDVWFHADTDDLLVKDELGDLLRHPNLGLFVRRPIVWMAWILETAGIGAGASTQQYQWLVLGAAPLSCALRTLAVYSSLLVLTQSRRLSVLLAGIDIVGIATVTLGSVPESYPLSAACLAGLYWLFATDLRHGRVRWLWWGVLGTVAVGVTTTNIVPFGILLGSLLLARGERPARLMLAVGAVGLAVVVATVILVIGSAVVIDEPLAERFGNSTSRYMRAVPDRAVAEEIAWAMAHTFVAPPAQRKPGRYTGAMNPDHDYVLLMPVAPIRDVARWWRALLPLAVLALGAAGHWRRGRDALWALPAAAILLGNFTLHLFFGHEFFLYGMHWAFSMVWIMAGVAFLPRRGRLVGVAAVVLLASVTAFNSVQVMSELIAQLQAA